MKRMNELLDIFVKVKDRQEMKKLFEELFTPAEVKDFLLRYQIFREISDGTTQREIASRYKMSLCKVTRGARVLKRRGAFFKKLFAGKKK